jgi:hypothetical protein
MLSSEFITMSLDLNLFFLRIMKEHSFFIEIAFTPKDKQLACEAQKFRINFENLLTEAVNIANGNVSQNAVNSNQFVTQYTLEAERLTNFYTGIPFNAQLTRKELMLTPTNNGTASIESNITSLNRRAFQLTSFLVKLKERFLEGMLTCKLFTLNYPLLIEHIIREAKLFMIMLNSLNERGRSTQPEEFINLEEFWNRQMAEHAKFIAGLLDPSEESLIDTARMFGKEFDKLTKEASQSNMATYDNNAATSNTIAAMERLRSFKIAGTEGILDCKIRSIIIPLLADHVLREANHYLCILGKCNLR